MMHKRLAIHIKGQVQGVGFRPHVYRVAHRLNLTGFVKNNAEGVVIEIEGEKVAQFQNALLEKLPPLARIDAFEITRKPSCLHETKFQIVKSDSGQNKTIISPDISICEACLSELFDVASRYYLYPFLNCTHCGPRFSITQKLPYDRQQTSMADFAFCAQCYQDYRDPHNRRYHAQPTACMKCGPQLSEPMDNIANAIVAGEIIALKGIGGYQLICDAKHEAVIQKLRARKNRASKPFALMVLNIACAKKWVQLSDEEKALLESPERPIVICQKKSDCLPENIAPGLSHYAVMLPSSPMHYLLFHALAHAPTDTAWLNKQNNNVLIVTSANISGTPLLIDDQKAKIELADIADKVIAYNRNIIARVDDSVLQLVARKPFFIRRARGYAPTRIKLPYKIPSTLALGAQLKNTFCITREDEAFVSQYIGSLTNKETIAYFHETLDHFQQFLGVQPTRVAHDLHPDFYTTQLAQALHIPSYRVQHHHAHLASVAAEYHIQTSVLGLVLDGYGYGSHGEAWGGECLLLEDDAFTHLGGLKPLCMPGGDFAAKEPWRMAASVLFHLGCEAEIAERYATYPIAKQLGTLLNKKINTPLSSSCGRLFDAASAILNINHFSDYEGQAARQLEALVTVPTVDKHGWEIENNQLNFLPLLKKLFKLSAADGANLFHGTLIAGLAEYLVYFSRQKNMNTVLLSGGCFQNRVLAEGLCEALRQNGIKPLLPRQLPPNDGGLSLGQAWLVGNNKDEIQCA